MMYFNYEFTYKTPLAIRKTFVTVEAPNPTAGRPLAREVLANRDGRVIARSAEITDWDRVEVPADVATRIFA